MSHAIELRLDPTAGHYYPAVEHEDIEEVLAQLPKEAWSRFQLLHFRDAERGLRWVGYMDRVRGELSVRSVPPGSCRTRR